MVVAWLGREAFELSRGYPFRAAAVFGSTIAAAFRTPAAGCFSAATAVAYELPVAASIS